MTVTASILTVAALSAVQQDTSTVRDTVVFLAEYVVSGSRADEIRRIDQPLAHSLASPTVVDRASGTVTAHLLRELSGVHVQQTSAGQGAVVLRGMVGNQVLMLVNGVPMNNATYRDGPGQYLATIDPETIERIEVVRGPASVLYGSDAQGGVANVITRPHPHDGPRSVRLSGNVSSADGAYRARVSGGIQHEHWSVTAGGTLTSVGDLNPGGDLGPQNPTGFDAEGVDATARLWLGEHSLAAVVQHFAMHGVPRYDRYVTFRAPEPGRDAEHLFDPQARQLAYVRHVFGSGTRALRTLETTVSLATQREGRHRTRLVDGEPDTLTTHWRDDVLTPGLSIVGSSEPVVAHRPVTLTWGAEWYHDMLTSEGFEENRLDSTRTPLERPTDDGGTVRVGNFPDGATANRLGVFVAGETSLTGFLRASVGLRWSHFRNAADVGTAFGGAVQNTSSDLTGQLGLVATPAERWRIAARVAEGFRAPNLYDLTRTGPVPGGVALPNPDARPEESVSGELSVRYSGPDAAFDVTAYYTRVTDFIDRVPGEFQGDTLFDGERVFQGQNVGTARIRGVEAEAIKTFGPLRLRAGLQYTYGDQTPASGVEEPMAKIPPLGGFATVRWSVPARPFAVEYVLRWATTQDRLGSRDLDDPRIPPGGTKGYTVHGVRVLADLPSGLEVAAGFENVFDRLYRTHASGVDAAGRHVWVGASWMFSVD
jgi:iron complex outermembrane receptor protein/hemoglobin/transferrin/lactoferrin receptor protein